MKNFPRFEYEQDRLILFVSKNEAREYKEDLIHICYSEDEDSDILHKYGSELNINAFYDKQISKLSKGLGNSFGLPEKANNSILQEMIDNLNKFSVPLKYLKEINDIIQGCGYTKIRELKNKLEEEQNIITVEVL